MRVATSGHEERVGGFFERVWNAQGHAAAEDRYGPKFTDPHAPGLSSVTTKAAAIAPYHAAFPDPHVDIVQLVARGEQVADQWAGVDYLSVFVQLGDITSPWRQG